LIVARDGEKSVGGIGQGGRVYGIGGKGKTPERTHSIRKTFRIVREKAFTSPGSKRKGVRLTRKASQRLLKEKGLLPLMEDRGSLEGRFHHLFWGPSSRPEGKEFLKAQNIPSSGGLNRGENLGSKRKGSAGRAGERVPTNPGVSFS